LQLSRYVEEQAFEKSHGIKSNYLKFVQAYFQQIQTAVRNVTSYLRPKIKPINVSVVAFWNTEKSLDHIFNAFPDCDRFLVIE